MLLLGSALCTEGQLYYTAATITIVVYLCVVCAYPTLSSAMIRGSCNENRPVHAQYLGNQIRCLALCTVTKAPPTLEDLAGRLVPLF